MCGLRPGWVGERVQALPGPLSSSSVRRRRHRRRCCCLRESMFEASSFRAKVSGALPSMGDKSLLGGNALKTVQNGNNILPFRAAWAIANHHAPHPCSSTVCL